MERDRPKARPGRVRWSDEVEIEDLYVRVPVLDDGHIWMTDEEFGNDKQGKIEDHLPALLREVGLPTFSASPNRDLDDVNGLAFANPNTSHSRPERLSCSREGFLLLGTVRRVPELSQCWNGHSSGFARIKKSRVDSPILVADAESNTAHSSWPYDPDLGNIGFPLVEVDEELNEGLPWPLSSREVSKDDVAVLKREKLDVRKKDLLFLQQAIKLDASSCASVVQADRDVNTKAPQMERLSSPLLPASPPHLHEAAVMVIGLPFLHPIPTSPTSGGQPDVEEAILEDNDSMEDSHIALLHCDTYMTALIQDPVHAFQTLIRDKVQFLAQGTTPHVKRSDMRVEGPLTPEDKFEFPKLFTLEATLQDAIVADYPIIDSNDEQASSTVSTCEIIVNTIRPAAERLENSLRHETLHEADMVARVKVPELECASPVLPWLNGNSISVQQQLKAEMVKFKLQDTMCPGIESLERQLRWAPSSAGRARMARSNDIGDDNMVDIIIQELDAMKSTDTRSLVSNPDFSHSLDRRGCGSNSGEDIRPGIDIADATPWSLPRKRERSMLDPEHRRPEPCRKRPSLSQMVEMRATRMAWTGNVESVQDSNMTSGKSYLASQALDEYLYIRGKTSKPTRVAEIFKNPNIKREASVDESIGRKLPSLSSLSPPVTQQLASSSHSSGLLALAAGPARTFIISSKVLSQRSLLGRIRQLYPAARFLEREFADSVATRRIEKSPARSFPARIPTELVRPPPRPQRHQKTSTPVERSSDIEEADILISPSTGIIWTTLQLIKQRALPGQVASSLIRERIAVLARRYERLILVVSEGRLKYTIKASAGTSTPTGSAERIALEELERFTNALDGGEVQVTYVPGGEEELAHRVVQVMTDLGLDEIGNELSISEEGTEAELHLRHAGLNAYAALVILAMLGRRKSWNDEDSPLEVTLEQDGQSGMAALICFVNMDHEERIGKFERLLGGTRVLDKIDGNLQCSRGRGR